MLLKFERVVVLTVKILINKRGRKCPNREKMPQVSISKYNLLDRLALNLRALLAIHC